MPELESGGGLPGIVQAIQANLTHPNTKVQREGQVLAEFIVDKEGVLQKIRIKRSLGRDYDQAVRDAIQKLPRFRPGRMDGKPVKVALTVPITFVLR